MLALGVHASAWPVLAWTVGSAATISPGTGTPILRASQAALSTGAPRVVATVCCDGVSALARIDQRLVGAHPIGVGMPVSSKGLGIVHHPHLPRGGCLPPIVTGVVIGLVRSIA